MGIPIIITGLAVAFVGVIVWLMERSGFRGLPGDVFFQKGNVTIIFPVVTMLVLSIVITIILNVIGRK